MDKHTPGPWKFGLLRYDAKKDKTYLEEKPFEYRGPGPYDNPSIVGADGTEVVGCDEYYIFNNAVDIRFITAAPELLEALQEIADSDRYEITCLKDDKPKYAYGKFAEIALRAIAKATS